MEESENFLNRLKDYIDNSISKKIAQNQDIENVINTNINGYRALGVNQFKQVGGGNFDTSTFGDGSNGPPAMGP